MTEGKSETSVAMFVSLHSEIRPCLSQIFGSLQLIGSEFEKLELDDLREDLGKIQSAASSFLELFNRFVNPDGTPNEEFELRQIRHDLRTPVGHMVGYSEMLQEEAEDLGATQLKSDFQRLTRSAHHLLGLINESFSIQSIDAEVVEENQLNADTSLSTGREISAVLKAAQSAEVLVVDDNESNCELLKRQLERHGHQVTLAENGRRALEKLERGHFDLILLDVMMPEMNGYETLEYVKAHPAWRHIPVIMVSANDELESVVTCIEMGAEDYIPKPINPIFLYARVNASLEKKLLRDQEQQYLRQIEVEQAKSESLLLNILPPTIAQRLKLQQTTIADSFPESSVIFADIIGFTNISSTLSPETLVNSLNILIRAYDALADRHEIEKIKTIGDAYMAAAGLPIPRADHAEAMIEMAFDMIEETRRLHPKLVKPFEIRVGICSGPVVAGVIGRKKFCYDLWGDTVNTASRMSSIGHEPEIRISESTYLCVRDKYEIIGPEMVAVKGKGEMPTYVVKSRRV